MKWLWIAGLVATVFVAAEVGYRIHRKRKARILLARRTNPTREEFLALMDSDADPAVADFMWDTIVFYTAPQVLPHPEDDLLTDYAIDDALNAQLSARSGFGLTSRMYGSPVTGSRRMSTRA